MPATEMERSGIEVHGLFCNAKERNKEAACHHEEVRLCFLLYRAQPATEMKRSEIEVCMAYFVFCNVKSFQNFKFPIDILCKI